ncbi:unnamed protein product [Brassica rapa]|uniref:Uncharacterized protein n=2 Tax=Brassica TaxID=3705 RepID=A0A3P6BDU2_BRACM|nr:unnamed protein product [Brassica napus]CAG7901696.1 unnamed protein product [Brassica rapa]CDY15698.1 BnaA07g08690D [Brassica napus]VDC97274.1 unnamed protein product [Brassica rapa]
MASHTLLCIQENEKDEVVTLLDELRSSTMQPSLYKVSLLGSVPTSLRCNELESNTTLHNSLQY